MCLPTFYPKKMQLIVELQEIFAGCAAYDRVTAEYFSDSRQGVPCLNISINYYLFLWHY